MLIRDAVASDIEEVTAIYNSIVLTSTAVYNERTVTQEDRLAWWQARVAQGYPFLVAVEEAAVEEVADEDNAVRGYATFGEFRPWSGYRFTVEGTVHISQAVRGRGVGTALLTELTGRARDLGKHVMIAGVDSGNVASLRFLQRFGFTLSGQLREVGFKFDRYLDLCFLQYEL